MDATETGRRIVVGIDGSPSSKIALKWAKHLSEMTSAPIDAVTAWELISEYGWSALPPYQPEEEMEKALTGAVDAVFGANRPKDLRAYTRRGPAATVLLDAAKDAYMIIVGSRGHGGFTGLLLGSVSSKVAELATCPVLVVHGDEPEAAS